MLNKVRGNKKGFTLMEIILVIALIGILVKLAVPNLGKFKGRTELARVQNDIKIVENLAALDFADKDSSELTDFKDSEEGLYDKHLNKIPAKDVKVKELYKFLNKTEEDEDGKKYEKFINDAGTELVINGAGEGTGGLDLYISDEGKIYFKPTAESTIAKALEAKTAKTE